MVRASRPHAVNATRGFAAVGLVKPKNAENVGHVMRAAHAFGAALVAIQGDRSPVMSRADTSKAWRHIPVLRGDDLFELCPFDSVPIAVELIEGAHSLPNFRHPERAFYVFGPEDGSLGAGQVERCKAKIMVPTRFCLNLAAAVNVVLYDRMAKALVA